MDYEKLIAELKAELQFRNIESPDDIVLKNQIKSAVTVINNCRNFNPTPERPYDKKYEGFIIPLCIYALSKVGIEGEVSHSENGVQRIYTSDADYPEDILSKIVPLARIK